MNQQLYQYVQQLYQHIQSQEQRISRLETLISNQEKLIRELKERPSIVVDKIEYKFDQLKVESLDGTLNIGLNPSDLQGIEDFAVENQGITVAQKGMNGALKGAGYLNSQIERYIDHELPAFIEEVKNQHELTLDESYIGFIKEDIKKQLPSRIEHYLKHTSNATTETRDEHVEKILKQIKVDIQKAVELFLSKMPERKE